MGLVLDIFFLLPAQNVLLFWDSAACYLPEARCHMLPCSTQVEPTSQYQRENAIFPPFFSACNINPLASSAFKLISIALAKLTDGLIFPHCGHLRPSIYSWCFLALSQSLRKLIDQGLHGILRPVQNVFQYEVGKMDEPDVKSRNRRPPVVALHQGGPCTPLLIHPAKFSHTDKNILNWWWSIRIHKINKSSRLKLPFDQDSCGSLCSTDLFKISSCRPVVDQRQRDVWKHSL